MHDSKSDQIPHIHRHDCGAATGVLSVLAIGRLKLVGFYNPRQEKNLQSSPRMANVMPPARTATKAPLRVESSRPTLLPMRSKYVISYLRNGETR